MPKRTGPLREHAAPAEVKAAAWEHTRLAHLLAIRAHQHLADGTGDSTISNLYRDALAHAQVAQALYMAGAWGPWERIGA